MGCILKRIDSSDPRGGQQYRDQLYEHCGCYTHLDLLEFRDLGLSPGDEVRRRCNIPFRQRYLHNAGNTSLVRRQDGGSDNRSVKDTIGFQEYYDATKAARRDSGPPETQASKVVTMCLNWHALDLDKTVPNSAHFNARCSMCSHQLCFGEKYAECPSCTRSWYVLCEWCMYPETRHGGRKAESQPSKWHKAHKSGWWDNDDSSHWKSKKKW